MITEKNPPPRSSVLLAHSSDIHIGGHAKEVDLRALVSVIETAKSGGADALLLAGDVFDHNRLALSILDATARLLADAGMPVIILPGNHDCLTPSSVYRRGGLAEPENVHVFGVDLDEQITLPGLDLGLWGKPHLDYENMSPLRDAPARFARWQVAVAHGHWLEHAHDHHRSWILTNEEIAAMDADYLALGHWDRPTPAGDGSKPAYYSGSPDIAGTINLIRLSDDSVDVWREPLPDWNAWRHGSHEHHSHPHTP